MLYSVALYIALLAFTINRIARLGPKSTAVETVDSVEVRSVDVTVENVLVEV